MLLARTLEKLEAAASEIASTYSVETKVVVADFGKATATTWSSIREALAPLDVGILVNNVGLSYDHAEYFENVDSQLIDDLIRINIQATNKASSSFCQACWNLRFGGCMVLKAGSSLQMTQMILPSMKSRSQSSAIINIGSAAATVAPSGPLYAVYAGTKVHPSTPAYVYC